MERNRTMMQFFEWHLQPDHKHWIRLEERAKELKEAGIGAVWIPPVTKGVSSEDNGYGVYDFYDLGEFDQKGAIPTKYGTKEELENAIRACHDAGVFVYIDVVMNHKAGADEKEVFKVVEVDQENREKVISKEPFDIEGWTKFTFPGRKGKYSDFIWTFEHFNGTDYDAKKDRNGVFRIEGENKKWSENVDDEFGNYDFLMFANIDYNHPKIREEMIRWGKWIAETLDCDGFRLDAIKHIDHEFIDQFTKEIQSERGDDFFYVGEFWVPELDDCAKMIEITDGRIHLFDVPLKYNLFNASQEGAKYDLTKIFEGSIVENYPLNAVTFVDNHDTQPGESLESFLADWFKQSAYALILLRKDGYPCVFYGDYYGIGGEKPVDGKKEAIDPLLYSRLHKAYGEQEDYFDHPNTIGWVRRGVKEIERSGCAVVINNSEEGGSKKMYVGEDRAGENWVDFLKSCKETIEIGEDGWAVFPVNAGSVSVWGLPDQDVE
ncbi:alpha-amylase [Domibacillus epiphyticus]|uniref:Alpha-amylase n=1 Tax=Domibacillus epiphyticus TaxID=1714355 RepID=A0A1V2AAT3_9BACI|nr:alpha-amylase [Domibacillus epiphyticus]OMP68060.1 alpha-amylase [Domibacillus epiphyticus]